MRGIFRSVDDLKAALNRCRAPTRAQRDVKRARIVLPAAEGRSTRSIAEEVGVQPRIVSTGAGALPSTALVG